MTLCIKATHNYPMAVTSGFSLPHRSIPELSLQSSSEPGLEHPFLGGLHPSPPSLPSSLPLCAYIHLHIVLFLGRPRSTSMPQIHSSLPCCRTRPTPISFFHNEPHGSTQPGSPRPPSPSRITPITRCLCTPPPSSHHHDHNQPSHLSSPLQAALPSGHDHILVVHPCCRASPLHWPRPLVQYPHNPCSPLPPLVCWQTSWVQATHILCREASQPSTYACQVPLAEPMQGAQQPRAEP